MVLATSELKCSSKALYDKWTYTLNWSFSQLHLDHNVPIQSTKPKVIFAKYVDDPIIPYDIGELQWSEDILLKRNRMSGLSPIG
jgi:hypothetical protein